MPALILALGVYENILPVVISGVFVLGHLGLAGFGILLVVCFPSLIELLSKVSFGNSLYSFAYVLQAKIDKEEGGESAEAPAEA